jgi:hypothetical protein
MKNISLFTLLVFIFATVGAQTTDYLQKKEFQTEKKKIYDNIDAAKKPASDLKKQVTRQSLKIDSLNNVVKIFSVQNTVYADSINKMGATVTALDEKLKVNHAWMKTRLGQLLIITIILLLFVLVCFFILRRKIQANFVLLKENADKNSARLDTEIEAIRMELKESLAKMKGMSDELTKNISNRFDQFEAEHGQVHLKIQDNNSSLKEQIQVIRESAEEKYQTFKSSFAQKTDEILSQTKAIKSQVDKEIQVLTTELKKVKPV